MRIAASLNERHFYKFELNNSSRLNIQKIKNSIKNKHFISKDQRERLIRNHKIFLQNEFLDIIKTESNDASYAIIFDDNNETLKNKFLADKEKLINIFKVNEDNIKKKVEVIQYDPMNDPKKKTNFVLKENENLKEIQVSVEIGNDLTSVIEQDF